AMNPIFVLSETFISDQKCALLFNINESLEIPMQEFDNKYYRELVNDRRKTKVRPPKLCFAKIRRSHYILEKKIRVEHCTNSPNYTHILEESNKLKHSQAIWSLVKEEVLKNYQLPEIINAIKELITKELGLDTNVKELQYIEVTNIKYKVHGSLKTYLIDNSKFELNLSDIISFFKQQGYYVKHFKLTLIDFTHQMNWYDYSLFTLYIRNKYGCWETGAHFFKPKYFLADQSNIKENSINMAFPGFQNGEPDAAHKIVEIDLKKYSDSKYVVFNFHIIKISVADIDHDILQEIYRFPFPIQ
ncbi:1624_t:CDS:2, partial [Cetraspora pellucida]